MTAPPAGLRPIVSAASYRSSSGTPERSAASGPDAPGHSRQERGAEAYPCSRRDGRPAADLPGVLPRRPARDRRLQDVQRANGYPGPDGKTIGQQWTIDPTGGQPHGFSFIYTQAEVPNSPKPIWVCVMVTAPANELIRRTIKEEEDDPRMPAILAEGYDVWATWLGEAGNDPVAAKALLKTVEGVTWQTFPEPKKPRAPRKS